MERARVDVRLSAERRRELDTLATETGLTAADLAKIGISWVLKRRDFLASGEERAA